MPATDADPPPPALADGKRGKRAPVGVIVNPHSHRNRRTGTALGNYSGGDVQVVVPESPRNLPDILCGFARREVGTIVIDGGDGTVRDVLTALPAAFGDAQPALALVPSGKTNLIVRTTGGIAGGAAGLDRLLSALRGDRPLRIQERPALDVTRQDVPDGRLRGMLFGAAAFTHGTVLANERLHPKGLNHGPAVALATAGVLWRALAGRGRQRLRAGEPITLSVDGAPAVNGQHFLVLVTPLDRLVFGLWPFADRGEGPLHWLDVAAPPRGLLRLTAATLRGDPPERMEKYGHRSGRAREITAWFSHTFVLDGEPFDPGPGVRLTASPPIRFLST